jgi:hypothetical protein
MTTHAFSPKGHHLALAVLHREQDFHRERTLVVCDLKANKAGFTERDVPLGPCFFSGRSNFLDLNWRTDEILEYGGPFSNMGTEAEKNRFADVVKQERLDDAGASTLPPAHRQEEPERRNLGQFELTFGEVYFPGEKTPIGSVLDEDGVGVRDLAIDSVGNWAAYSERKDDQVYVIDGARREKNAIHSGWVHDLEWFEVAVGK